MSGGRRGEEGDRERERGDRETQIRGNRKRGEGAERNEVSQRGARTRQRKEDRNEERRGEDWEEQKRRDHFSKGRTDPQLIIPSYLHLHVPLPHSLHMSRGYVILIKRNRVAVEPSICIRHRGGQRGMKNLTKHKRIITTASNLIGYPGFISCNSGRK